MRLCCGAADNGIGEAGAVAVSKALESGNCKLTSLNVGCESGVAVLLDAAVFGCLGGRSLGQCAHAWWSSREAVGRRC